MSDPQQNQERTKPKRPLKGILTMVGGVILMMYLGCFFLWGNISVYVLSYFYWINPNFSDSFIFLVDVFLVFSNWLGYQAGVYLLQNLRLNAKLIIFIGGFISLSGVYLSSFTTDLEVYLALYCCMNGIGSGINYFAVLILTWEWFPDIKGFITGIATAGFGFGSFIFTFISTKLVNPNGDNPTHIDNGVNYFEKDVADRVPFMIQTLVYIWTGMVVVAVILMSRKEPEQPFIAQDEPLTRETENSFISAQQYQKNVNVSTANTSRIDEASPIYTQQEPKQEEIRSLRYCFYSLRTWQLVTMFVFGQIFSAFFSYSFKLYGQSATEHPPISDTTLTWAASIGSGVINGLSRVVIGSFVDRVGFKWLYMGLMVIQLVNSLVCYWAAWIPAAYFTCILVNYMAVGGMYAIFPVTVTNIFGLDVGPKVYVWILLGGTVVSIFNLLETAVIEPLIGFAALFYINSVFQFLCIVVTCTYQEKLDVERLRSRGGLKSQEPPCEKEFKYEQAIAAENTSRN